MQIELKELSLNDGEDIKDMLQEIWPWENWFENTGYNMNFSEYLDKYHKQSMGLNLAAWYELQRISR